jgi:SAM-dependent methyltransferase
MEWQFGDGIHDIKRCLRCSIVFVHGRPTGTACQYDEAYFEQKYTDLTKSGYVNTEAARKRMLSCFQHAISVCGSLNGRPGVVLDVGCGTGRFLELAQKEGWRAEGLEPFPGAAEDTGRRLGIRVYVGGVMEASLPSKSFDIITMFDVIEHLERPVDALQVCERSLKPGGVLILTTPNFNGLGRRLMGKDAFAIWPDEHLVYFKGSTLRRALALGGFAKTELSTREIYPENVAMFLSRLNGQKQIISSRPTGSEESILAVKSAARGSVFVRLRSLANLLFEHVLWGDELLAFAKKA